MESLEEASSQTSVHASGDAITSSQMHEELDKARTMQQQGSDRKQKFCFLN